MRVARFTIRAVILLAFCGLPLKVLKATTAIALRSRYRIVLAADSRAVYGTTRQATECKLFAVGNVYATVSGLAHYGRSYRATDAIWDGFGEAGDFQNHVAATSLALQRNVEKVLSRLAVGNPAAYRQLTRPSAANPDLVQLALAQMVDGRPMLGIIELRYAGANDGLTATLTICPGSCRADNSMFYLGYWDRIKPYVADSGQPRSVGSAASIDRLIRMEITAHPKEVGGPINILELNTAGARWLQNGGNCSLSGVGW